MRTTVPLETHGRIATAGHSHLTDVTLIDIGACKRHSPAYPLDGVNRLKSFYQRLVVTACALGAPILLSASPMKDVEIRQMSRDIFKQLIEINTTDSVGSTTPAALAMAQRLWDAGFSKEDVVLLGPSDRKGNMVARYRGTSQVNKGKGNNSKGNKSKGKAAVKLRPILIIGHLDVVEARREDWSTDPFQFVEQDGYFYGRGTLDMKSSDAIVVTNFIRLKREGYVPNRDIILALTAAEEGGKHNGVDWLLKNHRDLIDAEYVLNPDGGQVTTEKGKPMAVEIEAAEKLYADFQVLATNPGGHSSLPTADNAIDHVAAALMLLKKSPFPFELNEVTREYLSRIAESESTQNAADMRAILTTPPDAEAIERLSADTRYNATLRTTCIPTQFKAGHAPNALPQRAEANVNCRIMPGHSQEEIRLQLVKIFSDPTLKVSYQSDAGEVFEHGSERKSMTPPPLNKDVMEALQKVSAKMWPNTPVIPDMETGASDSIYTSVAGMPSYGVNGIAVDRDGHREHGRDERVKVESYYGGVEFYYNYLKALTR